MNQPLAAIGLQAEVAARFATDPARDPELTACLEEIATQSQRAGEIVRSLRRMTAPGRSVPAAVEISKVVRATVRVIEWEARRAGAVVTLGLKESLPAVWGDRVQLEQVLFDLLLNAVQAVADASGVRAVRVETGPAAGVAIVTVRDTGQGLGPDDLDRVRAILHDEAGRHGHRAVDLPGRGGSARREAVGGERPGGRGGLLLPPANRPEGLTAVEAEPTIFVVDDDAAVSKALTSAGALLGHPVGAFASATEFLAAYDPAAPGCLVLDVKMPGMTGLELQRKLADNGVRIPVVMVSGHADVRIALEAMTFGALTLLEKPFRLDELMAHLRTALARDAADRAAVSRQDAAAALLAALTPKEREVLERIARGATNKDIAAELSLSVRAVEDRRARLMKKMDARSLADLVWALSATGEPGA